MSVLIVKNLWWPFGAHLLHMKWAYIHALINKYDFFYKDNNYPVFIDGSINYYYDSPNTINENELKNIKHVLYSEDIVHNMSLRGHYVPNEYANASEFHSFVLKKLYCPKLEIIKIINNNSLIQNLQNNNIKYIAVHIRLGDKINGNAKETIYIQLENYFNKCKEVKTKYGINTIVICSDTSDGLEKFISLNVDNDFKILFNDESRNRNIWTESIVQKVINGYNDKEKLYQEYLNCFVNFELLLKSEIIIGNFDSCFCLVPVEMRNNNKDININVNNIPLWGIRNKFT